MDRRVSSSRNDLEYMLLDETSEPKALPLYLLEDITSGFSEDQAIGRGAFSVVYKGTLANGLMVAVKRLLPEYCYMHEKEFHREVECLLKVNHTNVVKLLGYCSDTQGRMLDFNGETVMADVQQRLLCFEYLPKGSLHEYIEDPSSGLDWSKRYNIIKGMCEGLSYLHRKNIVHLDLKPTNILLDANMVPKISDFGISMMLEEDKSRFVDQVGGTFGYLAPEFTSNEITHKFDLYSLGVILMELLTGNRGYHAVDTVLESWSNRLDKTEGVTSFEQISVCAEIGIECIDPNPEKRPDSIHHIVTRLNETESSQFCGDDLGQSIIPSKSNITSGPSSGHAEASRSTHTNNYLSADEPMAMTFQELHHITDGFSVKRLLGKGGFGMVYKGVFDNGEVIAVKKLHNKPGLVEEQFKNELLNLVMVKHPNIIRLVGYCSEAKQIVDDHEGKKGLFYREERALCLEYLQGGNLEELLSDKSCELDWEERYRIIKGICQGLKHLHTGSKDPIYHLDLKPANILLDSNRIPKIGDFGLSRLRDSTETFVTNTYSGTNGYMPPEYMHGRQISSKFDVFSLGVIIIEIIAGPEGYYNYKCLMSPQEFINHVSENWSKRVQAKTMSPEELLEMQRCIKLALRCVKGKQAKRPSITEIVEELNMISKSAPFDADTGDESTLEALSIS